jgi:SpoVK/Ycf46/Vps4 family AAA+-type ATPase
LRSDENDAVPAPSLCVEARHFEEAFSKVQPSVSQRDERIYDRLRNRLRVQRVKPVDDSDVAAPTVGDDSSATV